MLWDFFCSLQKKWFKRGSAEKPTMDSAESSAQFEYSNPGESPIPKISEPLHTSSRRNIDMSAEGELSFFLDKYLYSRFPHQDEFCSITRITNKHDQLHGTDVRFISTKGKVYNVDEKAQLYYLNRSLPTFAFEINFLRNGTPTTGWLCNTNLDTDLYLLIWPYACKDTLDDISWHDFTKADCLLVSKNKLLSFLAQKGLSINKLCADADAFRANRATGKQRIPGLSGIYYYVSSSHKYVETPVNIVISRNILEKIATRHYEVTPEKVIYN